MLGVISAISSLVEIVAKFLPLIEAFFAGKSVERSNLEKEIVEQKQKADERLRKSDRVNVSDILRRGKF